MMFASHSTTAIAASPASEDGVDHEHDDRDLAPIMIVA
jgi:hypothetical protein